MTLKDQLLAWGSHVAGKLAVQKRGRGTRNKVNEGELLSNASRWSTLPFYR